MLSTVILVNEPPIYIAGNKVYYTFLIQTDIYYHERIDVFSSYYAA
jgi:hypothetical protein